MSGGSTKPAYRVPLAACVVGLWVGSIAAVFFLPSSVQGPAPPATAPLPTASGAAPTAAVSVARSINDAIENAAEGSQVTLPPGWIDATAEDGIRVKAKVAVRLVPHPGGTILYRTDGGSVLRILNSTLCSVSDLKIQPGPGGVGVDLQWDGGDGFNTNQITLIDLRIGGGKIGVRIGDGGTRSVSETTMVRGCYSGQSETSILLNTMNGQNTVVDGVYTTASPWAFRCLQGSFHLKNMKSVTHSQGVVYFANLSSASSIEGGYCEGTPRFLLTGGPSGVAFAFSIHGTGIYVGGAAPGKPAEAIRYTQGGPLTVEGCDIGTRSWPAFVSVGGLGSTPATVRGCSFWDVPDGVRSANGTSKPAVEGCTISSSTDAWPPKPYGTKPGEK